MKKFSGSGTPQARIIPVLADGTTEAATDIESVAPGTAEFSLEYSPWGETYVIVEAAETGGGNAVTVDWMEVSAQ